MHKPESVQENQTYKILWNFEIQTDHLIPARRQNLVIIYKKENVQSCGFYHRNILQNENQWKWKKRQVLRPCQRTEKVVEHVGDCETNCDWYICNSLHRQVSDIGLAVRVFTNGLGDLGSIPGRVIPKTQKMVLDASLLNTQHYKVQIKGKMKQSREGVAPSPTPWCSSYRKGSLRVTLD